MSISIGGPRAEARLACGYPHIGLRDEPKDDHVLEVAVAVGCDAIITDNRRDFRGVERFSLRVLDPREFLSEIGVIP